MKDVFGRKYICTPWHLLTPLDTPMLIYDSVALWTFLRIRWCAFQHWNNEFEKDFNIQWLFIWISLQLTIFFFFAKKQWKRNILSFLCLKSEVFGSLCDCFGFVFMKLRFTFFKQKKDEGISVKLCTCSMTSK